MSLRGLPDLGAPVGLDGATAGYRGFEDSALVLVPPRALRLSRRADGRPAFLMQRFRARTGTWPESHGVVTMTLEADRPLDQVLEAARAERPEARAVPATLAAGSLRMVGMSRVTDLAWDGVGMVTWSERVSPEEIMMLRGVVESAAPGVRADSVVEVAGVGARADLVVTVAPQLLSAWLHSLPRGHDGRVRRADVVASLRTDVLPDGGGDHRILVDVTGAPPADEAFAQVLADRIRSRWPGFVPPAPEAPGTWRWDLAEEVVTWREHLLTLPLFDEFSEVADHLADHEPPGVELDPVPAGWRTVSVLANLPTRQSGMEACGVDITAAPRPPERPQAVTATIDLGEDRPTGSVTLRLAPGEEPDFVRQTWAIVVGNQEVHELRGQPVAFHGERFTLRPGDFPVRFVPVEVEAALLELARVHVEFRSADGQPFVGRADFELTEPRTDLAVPAGGGMTMAVRLTGRTGTGTLDLGPYPPEPLWLGRHLLAAWGPHHLQVSAGAGGLTAVALRPETSDGDGAVVTLTPDHPERTWTWFADDPFRSGYQFRVVQAGTEPGSWSPVRRYDEPLDLAGVPA
ncbi:hypothetical protein [Nocardioides sp.]|uniref:hypothetical protein n=1 Tax=Nocardioides sp. TaxID=35761 RepID=UPI002B9B5B3D|nr:hypothetical protein [Nocardioides sp.]HSX68687.1 hypothetical protein [Nocardioides sp.]